MWIIRCCPLKWGQCRKGQTVVEFMLVLPFFLMVVFTVLLLAFAVIKAEMTTYSTFWGSRAAAVHKGDASIAESAAQEVLPGIQLDVGGSRPDTVAEGTYLFNPIIGSAAGNDVLNSPLTQFRELKTPFPLHIFRGPQSCYKDTNDNPIVNKACYE